MKTNKILLASIGVLVILNIVLITIVFMGAKHRRSHAPHKQQMCCSDSRRGLGKHFKHKKHGHEHFNREHSHEDKMKHFFKHKLDLTDAELEEVMKNKDAHMEYVKSQETKIKELNQKYFDCAADENCTEKDAIFQELQNVHKLIMKDRYKHFESMLNLVDTSKQDDVKKMLLKMSSFGPDNKPRR